MSLPASKSALRKLGKRLASAVEPSRDDERMLQDLLLAYDEFRQQAFSDVATALRGQFSAVPYGVSSRTKTQDTLIDKLRRSPEFPLGAIRDIAGIRVVLADGGTLRHQDEVTAVVRSIPNYDWGELIDRRAEPVRGYRAVHVIGEKDQMFVEVQVRTVLQDAWAQMYERMGDLYGREIRYGQIEAQTLEDLDRGGDDAEISISDLAEVVSLDVLTGLERTEQATFDIGAELDRVREQAGLGQPGTDTTELRATLRQIIGLRRAAAEAKSQASSIISQILDIVNRSAPRPQGGADTVE